jgi:predicted enzyme related to lactoylglutathione lyase
MWDDDEPVPCPQYRPLFATCLHASTTTRGEEYMPRVIHFEINADDPDRAVKFYTEALGWKISKWGPMEYWLIQTGEAGELGIDGAIMARENDRTTVNTISVPSLDEFSKRVEKAGGQVVSPRQTIAGIGYHSYCLDSEGNMFGILEEDSSAA